MRGVTKIRKARKERRCTEHRYHQINVGDPYLCSELPPEHDMNSSRRTDPGGGRWYVIGACVRCAKEYGLLSSETRKQLEAITPKESA